MLKKTCRIKRREGSWALRLTIKKGVLNRDKILF